MKRLIRNPHYVFILLGLFISMLSKADEWIIPQVQTYYSENKEYKLIITPKVTPDKYYEWVYYKNNKQPQTEKILREKEKFMQNISKQDTILIPCIAELYRTKGTDCILVWESILLNENCPVYAIVANNGSSVATFDNWYSIGYGVNVFVVYNEKGKAKRTYNLEEITPFPLNDYSISTSSLFWRKEVRYVDIDRIEIVFESEKGKTIKKIYNINKFEFEE